MKWIPIALGAAITLVAIFGAISYVNMRDELAEQKLRIDAIAREKSPGVDRTLVARIEALEKREGVSPAAGSTAAGSTAAGSTAAGSTAAGSTAAGSPDARLDSLERRVSRLAVEEVAPVGGKVDVKAMKSSLARTERQVQALLKRADETEFSSEDLRRLKGSVKVLQTQRQAHKRRLDALGAGKIEPTDTTPSKTQGDWAKADVLDDMAELRRLIGETDTKLVAALKEVETVASRVDVREQTDDLYRSRWVWAHMEGAEKGLGPGVGAAVDPLELKLDVTCNGLDLQTPTWTPFASQPALNVFLSPAGGNGTTCRLFASTSPDPTQLTPIRYRASKDYPFAGGRCLCTMGIAQMAEGRFPARPVQPTPEPEPEPATD
ncbi:MAG: hypothetical protein ACI9OJ_005870 [Myxococcota bacterium]|jgi:hypothetical protein